MSVDHTHTPHPARNRAAVTIEYFDDADPSMCWRVTAGDLHACGPTIEAAMDIIERAQANAA